MHLIMEYFSNVSKLVWRIGSVCVCVCIHAYSYNYVKAY